ncbi:MAG: Ku protein [Nitrospirae bacterium]|nr:Ku protein [Nitrospirota bacterium]MBI3805564.1 Ku protein [Candidatus Manganitrophaceae bacterium]
MAPRSFWKGSITFGLVNIPVKLYTATEDRPIKFHLLHKECNNRIQYKKYCPNCRREVSQEELVRAYPYSKDQFVILEDADFEKADETLSRTIEIINFVTFQEVDPIYYDRAYYVVPEEASAKAYLLLREGMKKTGQAAIGQLALREKGHLALLRPLGDAIGLETLYYPESIRTVETLSKEIPSKVDLKPKELDMAIELMKQLSVSFDPKAYRDTYREKLMEVIHNKIEGREITVTHPTKAPTLDLTEALKASLARTRERPKAKRKTA